MHAQSKPIEPKQCSTYGTGEGALNTLAAPFHIPTMVTKAKKLWTYCTLLTATKTNLLREGSVRLTPLEVWLNATFPVTP
jgi:hypothetical protein